MTIVETFFLRTGDVLDELRKMPADSVHCVVTSPPYWGLRDYGVEGQIGLEESFPAWIEKMREVFEEVRRVLRPDGTLWLNLGDAYAREGGSGAPGESAQVATTISGEQRRCLTPPAGLKHKDLMGQPWRVAFALQDAGWYLRSDIVWAKPNPMPESITDRPTKSHEFVFLFAKSERYFYDADAIREPYKPASISRRQYADTNTGTRIAGHQPALRGRNNQKQPGNSHTYFEANPSGRNRRDVWDIPTARYTEAHFATFPEDLVEPCLLAGTSEAGACSKCGAPLVRVIERGEQDAEHARACGSDSNGGYSGTATKDYAAANAQDPSAVKARILAGMLTRRTVGWSPSCECRAEATPCVVLDPFSGSGTTGAVALRYGRRYIGIELNPEYQKIARERLIEAGAQLGFNFSSAGEAE